MAESGRVPSEFTLELTVNEHAPSAGRLFIAVVLRTCDIADDAIEDVKIVVSEALTTITLAGRVATAQVMFEPDRGLVRIGPLHRDDLMAGDDFDLVAALFPDATIDHDGRLAVSIPAQPVDPP